MSEIKKVLNTNPSGKGLNGNVYSEDGIAPTLTTNKGEGNKVIVWGGTQENQAPHTDGICPSINAASGKGGGHTPVIGAVRGREAAALTSRRTDYGKEIRKQYESGEIKEQRKHMQQLEIRDDGLSNTLTTVQKDNLVVEPSGIYSDWFTDYKRGSLKGLSRSLLAKKHNAAVVLPIKNANIKGYAEAEPGDGVDIQYLNQNTRRGRVQDKISHTLQCTGTGAATVTSDLRIRKLTPLECMRLMDFDDDDFYKIKAVGLSNSRVYECAGDSICVGVLEAIFNNMR